MANDNLIEDQKLIQDKIWHFYYVLYQSKQEKSECDIPFENIRDDTKNEDKNILDEELTRTEIDMALKQMKNGKSTGIDGSTPEILKHFWDDIRELL